MIVSKMSTYQEYYCLEQYEGKGLRLAVCDCSEPQRLKIEDGMVKTAIGSTFVGITGS